LEGREVLSKVYKMTKSDDQKGDEVGVVTIPGCADILKCC
jgi:hypothetical protein